MEIVLELLQNVFYHNYNICLFPYDRICLSQIVNQGDQKIHLCKSLHDTVDFQRFSSVLFQSIPLFVLYGYRDCISSTAFLLVR